MGRYSMSEAPSGPLALLKKLRGAKGGTQSAGARQMAMLRRLPQILRFIPGTAQDVRAYFLSLQYWLGGSDQNIANMVRLLLDRYADGPRRHWRGALKVEAPVAYPDMGVYHPRLKGRIGDRVEALPAGPSRGTVGLLLMRSYLLAGNTGHYDGVIAALETRGLRVVPAFATGLDARPAIEQFFMRDGQPCIDALVSLTGFSLVGGPAYNDATAAEDYAGPARRPVYCGDARRVPDARAVGVVGSRPHARRGNDDGCDSRARRRDRSDGLRRPLDPMAQPSAVAT